MSRRETIPGRGWVALVGAGPGDPGLLTLRGRDLLAAADAVVIDALAPDALLRECRPDVAVHAVGKRAGRHSATQEEINALLVELAARGLGVVRLKGGDPFVFGRGGEECEALAAAGVAFEVVPGVSSAVAAPAYAGIPVTHRDWASHVTVVTGHERGDRAGAEAGEGRVDWGALARLLPDGTLVVLMGARSLAEVAGGLVAGGADPATPAAAVQWGTDPRQRTVVGTLEGIVGAVGAAAMGSPMVTVIGRVAALGARLGWLRRPLAGRRILVTRARAGSSGFLERLRGLGADAVELPVIAIEPSAESAELEAALLRLGTPHPVGRFAVFSSQVAVGLVLDAVERLGRDVRLFAHARVVAVGPETAAALRGRGLRPDLVPGEAVGEALADLLVGEGIAGAHVWLPRSALARDVVPERLAAAGAEVEALPLYRAVLPPGAADRLRAELARGDIDAVTFTSSSTVRHFVGCLGGAPFPDGVLAACIGPVTARTAEAAGVPVGLVAAEHTTAGLAAALAAHLGAGHPDTGARGGVPR